MLQPTDLVHDAAVRLLGRTQSPFNDREHFFRTMIVEMRRLIIDAARRRKTAQQYLNSTGSCAETITDESYDPLELLIPEDALRALARINPEVARIAELRLLGGLSHAEIAAILAVPQRTVERRWAFARSRLMLLLEADTK